MRISLKIIVGFLIAGLILFSSCRAKIDCPAYGKNHNYKKYNGV